MFAIASVVHRRKMKFELKLLEAAERGCPVASPIMPEMHRERARAATKAGRGCVSLPSSVVQYIDDIHGKSMGKVRAMVGLLSAWQEMERMNVPYGVEENTKEWPPWGQLVTSSPPGKYHMGDTASSNPAKGTRLKNGLGIQLRYVHLHE